MARRYKQGLARTQEALLPPRVEDYVSEDNLVRAIDAYVDTLDLQALGFTNRVVPFVTFFKISMLQGPFGV
ncbi:MAG: hypothetical protein LGR52_16030 [Candidatus Thiosymbion ectosymbiont of Robbea hypermnestra]|nr:hypothetical protein [Candidatus Thiosymbion ectosymbiont of Robbea hypermnestra]